MGNEGYDRFEIGKVYRHASGHYMKIVGSAQTMAWGWCLLGEEQGSRNLIPVGTGDSGYMQNWVKATDEEWERVWEEPRPSSGANTAQVSA